MSSDMESKMQDQIEGSILNEQEQYLEELNKMIKKEEETVNELMSFRFQLESHRIIIKVMVCLLFLIIGIMIGVKLAEVTILFI